jgi:hypothetical protein
MNSGGYLCDEGNPPPVRAVPCPVASLLRLAFALGRSVWAALRAILPPVPFGKARHRWYEARGVHSSGS